MNILIVSLHEPSPFLGGIERMSSLLIKQFSKDGHKVRHLALHRSGHLMPDGVSTDYFPSENTHSVKNQKFLSDYISTHSIDIILNQYGSWGNESGLFLSDDRVVRISELHSNPALLLNFYYKYLKEAGGLKLLLIPFIPFLKHRYRKARETHFAFLNEHNDGIVLLSDKYKTFRGLQTSKVVSIPNAVEKLGDENIDPHDKLRRIVYVGRLERLEKAPQELIKAFAHVEQSHPDWELVIVGDGPDRKFMEETAACLNIKNITFTGFAKPEEYYKSAAIHCLTSNNEGFPLVLIEGMAYKSVPVAYDSFPVASEIIEDNVCGLLAKPRCPKDLAKRLCFLIENPTERFKMAEAAYQKARDNYYIETVADKWYKLFNDLIGKKRR